MLRLLTPLLACALALGAASVSLAQDGPPPPPEGFDGPPPGFDGPPPGFDGPPPPPPMDPARMAEELGLTPEQAEAFGRLQAELREALREQGGPGRGDPRALFEAFEGKLEDVLTPEQLESFREQRRERRPERGRRGPPPRRDLRGEALAALNLDDETAAAIQPLIDAVVTADEDQTRHDQELRAELVERTRGEQGDDALQSALAAYRAAREHDAATLEAARAELRGVLSLEQESQLVGLGLLR